MDGVEQEQILDVEVEMPIYGGKTVQKLPRRFKQHLDEKPDWAAKQKAGKLKIEPVVEGEWTPYETAVHEKHVIEQLKKINPKLENVENPISKESFEEFRDLHDPCL